MTDEMCPQGTERKARVARGAAKQWGNVTRRQLAIAGFSAKEVHGMLRRALVDIAAAGWPIDRLTHEAAASGLTSLVDLRAYAKATERKGVRTLREALALPHTRSRGEERLRAYLERRGLPVPEMNARLDGMTVDGYIEALNLVIELDHPETHGSAFAQRRDAARDARHRSQGREVIRIEKSDFAALADEIEARLRRAA